MKIYCSHTDLISVKKIKEHPDNPNKHSQRQIEILAEVMKKNGVRKPITVSKRSGYITSGHGRLLAAKLNKWKTFPVDYQDYKNDSEEYADLVADNAAAELSSLDMSAIYEASKKFKKINFQSLGVPEFEVNSLKRIKNSSGEVNIGDFDNFDHECPKCGFEWDNET